MGRAGTLLLFCLAVVAVAVAGAAVWQQPRMGDDWDLAWRADAAGSAVAFAREMYLEWTGRLLPSALAGIFLSSEAASAAWRLLTVPVFLALCAGSYYLATGLVPVRRHAAADFAAFSAILWLGLPVVAETVVWQTGATYYLWPATAGVALLCALRVAERAERRAAKPGALIVGLPWLVTAAAVATGNEQMTAAMLVLVAGWAWQARRGHRALPAQFWWAAAGLLVGALILVAAPGNYARLAVLPQVDGGPVAAVQRAVMYLAGAYFALGAGDYGRTLWLGIALLLFCAPPGARRLGRDTATWLAASMATLLPIVPIAHAAAPRTTFLATLFLVVAVRSALPPPTAAGDAEAERGGYRLPLSLLLSVLVIVDGFVGWAANRQLAYEMRHRVALVQQAAADGRRAATVPYLATVPSRLTHVLHADHDAEFLAKLAARHGLEQLRHDDSPLAPRPYTRIPLKELRNVLR